MITRVDECIARAPVDLCFRIARDVERWPRILHHYRRVHFRQRLGPGEGEVEMAAWRIFRGPIRYPVWWVSEMHSDEKTHTIDYLHVDGITRGMTVRWEVLPADVDTLLRVSHSWTGPNWPILQQPAWEHLIGPHFVSAVARRTLAGITIEAQRQTQTSFGS
jgi:uncharacterized membrane protein